MRMTGASPLSGYTDQSKMAQLSVAKAVSQKKNGIYNNNWPSAGNFGGTSSVGAYQINALLEKTKTAAQKVREHGENLMNTQKDGLFAKAEEKGDTSEIVKEVGLFVEEYNTMVKNMDKTGGTMNDLYTKQLQENYENNKEALNAVGISTEKDGTLTIDQEKLKKADISALKAAFGTSDSFGGKVSAKSIYIESNAVSGQKAAGSGYNSYGRYLGSSNYENARNSFGGYGSANDFNSMIGSLFQSLF